MNRNKCYCTVENVSKNCPHSNVLYALYTSAHVYMRMQVKVPYMAIELGNKALWDRMQSTGKLHQSVCDVD